MFLPFASIQAVGSLEERGPLAGMVLIPVLMTVDKTITAEAGRNDGEIIRPVKPILASLPPKQAGLGSFTDGHIAQAAVVAETVTGVVSASMPMELSPYKSSPYKSSPYKIPA